MGKKDVSKAISQYISECWTKAESYKSGVESGSIVAGKWIKLAIARSRADEQRTDIYYNRDAASKAFGFCYHIRISTGEKYEQFHLEPFQAWIISEIFGWYKTGKEHKRRYRYATIYTARKSGKTTFVVVIELLVVMYDGQVSPEAYLCATTREQAGQALKYSKDIVSHSPALRKRLVSQQFQIKYPKNDGLMKVLANKPDKNDSLNPSIYIMDEMHAHPTLDFLNVMKSGTLFRKNPLGINTSTAGFNKEYPFYKMIQTAQRVLEGIVEDDITFYALYTLDEDDDIEDYSTWAKANPNIGTTIQLDDMIAEYKKASLSISERNNFITKNLNRYLDNIEQWVPDEVYVKCAHDIHPRVGERPKAFGAIDMSSVRDLSALVFVFDDPETSKLAVKAEFYFPKNEIKRIRESGIDLGEWIEKGYIMEMDKPAIDHEFIYSRFLYWNTIFEIVQFNYDEWNTGFLVPKIQTELFIDCRPFRQTTIWFNFPLKYIEKLFFEENIATTTNPVMRWMFRNIRLYYDGNGNIKIMKNKSLDSVDGPVALAMAVGAWLQYNGDATADFFRQLMASREGAGKE